MKQVLAFAVVSALALGFAATARAQSNAVKCHVSFAFYAGDREMPAGDYTVEQQSEGSLLVTNISGKAIAMVMSRTHELSSVPAESTLVFNRYGDHYYLAQVVRQGQQTASDVQPSRAQLKLARAAAPATVPVSAK